MRPTREHATSNRQTYMVTTETWQRRALFRNESWPKLLVDTLYHYRGTAYLLHEFVIMPDHIHVLMTPITSLEKAVQFIKGGFSYRAKKELGSNMEICQTGFQDRRIRDASDYDLHVKYIRQNPVRKHLCESPQDYPYSSAHAGFELDNVPQGLKPLALGAAAGAPEGAPLQSVVNQGHIGEPDVVNPIKPTAKSGPYSPEQGKDCINMALLRTTNDERPTTDFHAQTH